VAHYTVGQRRGLGISLGVPVFVSGIDAESNTVTVGARDDLAVDGFSTVETSYVGGPLPPGRRVLVQHRAHGDAHPATVVSSDGSLGLTFDEPVEAVARGQSAAFYSTGAPDELLGGGVIASTTPAPVRA
jgi:tRNA-specific 2-thiouridylase